MTMTDVIVLPDGCHTWPERGLSANVPVYLIRRVMRVIVDRTTLQGIATRISVRPHSSIAKAQAQTS